MLTPSRGRALLVFLLGPTLTATSLIVGVIVLDAFRVALDTSEAREAWRLSPEALLLWWSALTATLVVVKWSFRIRNSAFMLGRDWTANLLDLRRPRRSGTS